MIEQNKAPRSVVWIGVVTFVIAVLLSINSYRHDQNAVQSAIYAERLSVNVLNSLPVAVIACTADDRVIVFNHAAEILTGWDAKAILGGTLTAMVPQEYKYDHVAAYKRAAERLENADADWQPISCRDTEVMRADGKRVPVKLSIRGVRNGKRMMFVAVLQTNEPQPEARSSDDARSRE